MKSALPFSKYSEAIEFLFRQLPMYQRVGPKAFKKNLDNIRALCVGLGNPQDQFKSIHIAGTNGKGTVSHIVAGGLQSQGFKVGMYTSPHYVDFRERIKINGTLIRKKEVLHFVNTHRTIIERIRPSFFEITVAMAFDHFSRHKVDYAIIEVGLGGRLDSTNIIRPLVSVITNISFDHTPFLGDTLREIAGEKAGIIKKNIPVIIGEKQDEVQSVFIEKTKNENADIAFASDLLEIQTLQHDGTSINYAVKVNEDLWIDSLETDIMGPFQESNLTTALYVLYFLREQINLDVTLLKDAFPAIKKVTHYIGRWQVLGQKPLIVVDSAHNEAGIRLVTDRLSDMEYGKLHIVLGFVSDKQIEKMLCYFPISAKYYFAKANVPRGMDKDILLQKAQQAGLKGKAYSSVRKAFAAAKMCAQGEDVVFVGGSIFVVAEVL